LNAKLEDIDDSVIISGSGPVEIYSVYFVEVVERVIAVNKSIFARHFKPFCHIVFA
jgi:nucleoside-triphosphatase THEP1